MKGKTTLFLDQYGNRFIAKTVSEPRSKIGGGGSRVSRMFQDKTDGRTVHVGYVIGDHWLTAFQPVEQSV
jgi:hypothetical protein